RYATAQELADDLRRFLEDKPIRGRRPTMVQRAKKWTRRHLAVVGPAGLSFVVVLLLAVVGLGASTLFVLREKAHTDLAKEDLERTLYYQRIALADREWSANDLGHVEHLLEACPLERRDWEWHYLKRLRLGSMHPLRHPTVVLSVAFHPGG